MSADRYEPGPTGGYGADGIPREGMTERYATALWRDDPGAFWLHPEGPLSDTTPEEYFVPRPPVPDWQLNYAAQGLANSGAAMNAYQNAYNQAMLAQQSYQNRTQYVASGITGFGNIFGGLLF